MKITKRRKEKTVDLSFPIWYNTVVTAEKLRKIYASAGVDVLFVEQDFLREYLTGYHSSDGYVLLDGEACYLIVDARYIEGAQKQLSGGAVTVIEGTQRTAEERIGNYRRVGVPFPFLSAEDYLRLTRLGSELVDCMPALNAAMLIKSREELDHIARACEIAEDAFKELVSLLKEGVTETETAALLEYGMRKRGAEGVSFETICAFGENGSVPHYNTGARKLRFGDPVLIDFGCKVNGYCSDMTRTFLFGDDGTRGDFKRAYSHVLAAHERVKERLASGMTGKEADAIARDLLREAGISDYFTHSLGHGIGLRIHEPPYLSPRSEEVLADGMVFSDEPGVYFKGEFGIRIEDSVAMKDGKAVSFMKRTGRELIIL